jgi:hypothetical protein
MTNLETLDKEAQVLRATIDAKRVDEASKILAQLKVRPAPPASSYMTPFLTPSTVSVDGADDAAGASSVRRGLPHRQAGAGACPYVLLHWVEA